MFRTYLRPCAWSCRRWNRLGATRCKRKRQRTHVRSTKNKKTMMAQVDSDTPYTLDAMQSNHAAQPNSTHLTALAAVTTTTLLHTYIYEILKASQDKAAFVRAGMAAGQLPSPSTAETQATTIPCRTKKQPWLQTVARKRRARRRNCVKHRQPTSRQQSRKGGTRYL